MNDTEHAVLNAKFTHNGPVFTVAQGCSAAAGVDWINSSGTVGAVHLKRTRARFLVTPFVLLLPCALALFSAEFDLRQQLIDLNDEVRKQPRKAELYVSRGDLYRAQQKWDAAQADYDYAAALDAKLEMVDFCRGRLFFEANWPMSAKLALDRFLAKQRNHVEALILRARTLTNLQSRLAAARDYTHAIQLSTESRPELYVERAQTLAAEGGSNIKEALQGLDEGVKKLGPLVTLQLAAVDLELAAKNYDGALARLETIAAASPRKETWLARKGDILQQAGRTDQARNAFNAALESINSLPANRRNVPAVLELQEHIQEQLRKLK